MAFKFRHKVLFALGACALLTLVTLLSITLWRLSIDADGRARQGLELAREAFYRARQVQAEAVADAVESLASTNPELRAVLASRANSGNDPFAKPALGLSRDGLETLESSLPFLPLYQRSAEFAVADRNGELLLVKDRTLLPAGGGTLVVAAEALKGANAYDWWRSAAGITYQIFASPVVVQSEVVGTVLVGYAVDHTFLDPLSRLTRTGIELTEEKEEGVHELTRSGGHFLGSVVPVKAPSGRRVGAFLVTRSIDEELRGARALRWQLLLAGFGTLLVALGLGFYLSYLVSSPLELLGGAVRQLTKGNFGFRIQSADRDEFGALSNLIDDMAKGLEEREKIRSAFGRYVDDSVVDEVLRAEGAGVLAGGEKVITVLFADLANFTAFSEGKAPEQLLLELNGYFSAMAGAVEGNRGVIDKFIGDAVMAYWGAPAPNPEHALQACNAALQMAEIFRKDFAPRYPGLGLRIGLATGTALIGNVGSEHRRNFTVMGDTVNLASRLEGANKAFGTVICVSQATRQAVGGLLTFRLLGRVRVAGRTEPEPISELVADPAALSEAIKAYELSLPLFEAGDFAAATELLKPFAEQGDGPSAALLQRLTDNLRHDRRSGPWDGVWNLSK
jgi:class 3 adenylate cyclase